MNHIHTERWPAIREAIAAYVPPGPETWFWPKVNKNGPVPEHRPDLGPCWLWTGGASGGGYGSACRDAQHVPAHRLAWEITNGPISDGLWVLHHCDNKPCVNPAHLFLGTPKANVDDMTAKNRADFWGHGRGERQYIGGRKLTEADVVEIRRLYRDTRATQMELRRAFDVSQGLISGVIARRFWRHVD